MSRSSRALLRVSFTSCFLPEALVLAAVRLVSCPCSTGVTGQAHPGTVPRAGQWYWACTTSSWMAWQAYSPLPHQPPFPAFPLTPAPRPPGDSRAAPAPQSPLGSCDIVVLEPRAASAQHTEKRTGAPCQRAGWENGGNGSELAARILVSTPLFWAVSTIAK